MVSIMALPRSRVFGVLPEQVEGNVAPQSPNYQLGLQVPSGNPNRLLGKTTICHRKIGKPPFVIRMYIQ